MADARTIRVTILGDASGARSAFSSVSSGADEASVKVDGLSSHLSKLGEISRSAISGASFAIWNKALDAVTNFMSGAKESIIGTNAALETGAVSWKVLLGGADQANAKIQELYKFAADTPFEFNEVQQASLLLQTFGGNALNTSDTLTMVGNVASGTNQSFQEVAFWAGRMYSAMQSGQPFGEAAMRMQEMGAISGDTLTKLEAMQKAGASGTEMWNVFTGSLGRFNGMMVEQSNTFNGRLGTMHDTLNMFLATAGKPIFDRASESLQHMINLLSSPQAQAVAQDIAKGLTAAYDVLDQILAGVAREAARAVPYLGLVRDTFITMGQAARGNWFGGQTESINVVTRSLGRFVQLGRDAVLTFTQAFRGDWAGEATRSINVVVRAFGIMGTYIRQTMLNIRDLFTGRENLAEAIGRMFSDRGSAIHQFANLLSETLLPAVGNFLRALPSWFASHNPLPMLGEFLSDRFADLVHFVKFDAAPFIGGLFDSLGTFLSQNAGALWSGLGDAMGDVGGFILKLADGLAGWVNDHPDQIIERVGSIGTTIAGLITSTLSQMPLVGEGTLDVLGGAKGAGEELGKNQGPGQEAMNTIYAAGARLASNLLAGIGEGLLQLANVISAAFVGLFSAGSTQSTGSDVHEAGVNLGNILGQGAGAQFRDRLAEELSRLKEVALGLVEILGDIFANLATNIGIYVAKGLTMGALDGIKAIQDQTHGLFLPGFDPEKMKQSLLANNTFQPINVLSPEDQQRLNELFNPTPAYMQATQGGTQGDDNGQNGPAGQQVNQGAQSTTPTANTYQFTNNFYGSVWEPGQVVQAIGDGLQTALGGSSGRSALMP